VTTAAIAVAVFVTVTLSGEGLVYAAANPAEVLVSRTLLYFLAAGLVGTGVAYWALRHWREFTGDATVSSESGRL
jgi:high-affinity Fe2+/Pb2+ permease